jgi:hypothetical protein
MKVSLRRRHEGSAEGRLKGGVRMDHAVEVAG